MHKKRKLCTSTTPPPPTVDAITTGPTPSDAATVSNHSNDSNLNPSASTTNNDDIETFDVRKKQAEVHRVHLNPMATFSISKDNDADHSSTKTAETESNALSNEQNAITPTITNHGQSVDEPTPYVVAQQTAASMYKVDDDNAFVSRGQLPEAPELQRVLKPNPLIENPVPTSRTTKAERLKALRQDHRRNVEGEDVITISRSDHLLKDQDSFRRTFEIDDIAREEIKIVRTGTYNGETGQMEQIHKDSAEKASNQYVGI